MKFSPPTKSKSRALRDYYLLKDDSKYEMAVVRSLSYNHETFKLEIKNDLSKMRIRE